MQTILGDATLFCLLQIALFTVFFFENFYRRATRLIGSIMRIPAAILNGIRAGLVWFGETIREMLKVFPLPQSTEPVPDEDTGNTVVQAQGARLTFTGYAPTVLIGRSPELQNIVAGYFALLVSLFAAANDFSGTDFQIIWLLIDSLVLAQLCYATHFGDRLVALDRRLRVRKV